jgi:hypothetical protein
MNRACITYDCIRALTAEIGTITIACDLIVPCNLYVTGDTFLNRNLTVQGEATFNYITRINSNLTVTGNTNLNNTQFFGVVIFNEDVMVVDDATITINGNFVTDSTGLFQVNRTASFTNGIDANQTTAVDNFLVRGNGGVNGTFSLNGTTIFNGPVIFTQCPTFPPGCSFTSSLSSVKDIPIEGDNILMIDDRVTILIDSKKNTPITLDINNSGKVIDAMNRGSHKFSIGKDISHNCQWNIYADSSNISFINLTGKNIILFGIFNSRPIRGDTYTPGENISILEGKEYKVYNYSILISNIDDNSIRMLVHANII